MTSKDKTGDQLVASIRKSKTGKVAQKTRERSTARKAAPGTVKKPAPPARTERGDRDGNGYSHGRRVWPD